jgi:putative SOS response-associated peptidase YedK
MCNLYSNKVAPDAIAAAFEQLRIPLRLPEGMPNIEPREEIRITDRAPIVRWGPSLSSGPGAGEGAAELVQRRWSWAGPGGKPVYNFRSDGREFGNSERGGRCLIVTDGFYEFTTPEAPRPDKRKDRWLFTMAGQDWFCIAGLWRATGEGEAFTMLTTEPGPGRRALPSSPGGGACARELERLARRQRPGTGAAGAVPRRAARGGEGGLAGSPTPFGPGL